MANLASCPPLTRSSVITAHELIQPYIHRTPVLTNKTINEIASTPQSPAALDNGPWKGRVPSRPKIRLYFKCENLQRVGAFKARGAFHAILRLLAEEKDEGKLKEKGVVAHSSGNHAQALALAAKTMSIPAYIVMPRISTPAKIAATAGYGATITFSGSLATEREAAVSQIVKDTNAIFVPSYDHPDIMLGQGTAALELQSQAPDLNPGPGPKGLDAIITPCGGGGLLSGTALACEGTGIRVFGSEPSFQGADDCRRGIAAGKRIESVATMTIADGLRTHVGKLPWSVIYERKLVQGVFAVTEDQIKQALRLVLERMKIVVEPSAVVPLAVVLFNEDFREVVEREAGDEGWDLGVVFTGGNVSLEALGKFFSVEGEKKEDAS